MDFRGYGLHGLFVVCKFGMKWTQQDIERVRNISIASEMGIHTGRRVKIRCPMPDHNDGTASFLIDEENTYHCFGCKAHGSNFIDFATEILLRTGEAKDEKEAFVKIMEEYK